MSKMFQFDPSLTEPEDAALVEKILTARGLKALYGGGTHSKGHGFWVSYDAQTLYNDAASSGNPAFWMADDAAALASLSDSELDQLIHRPGGCLCAASPSNHQDTKAWLAANYSWRSLADRCLKTGNGIAADAAWLIDFYVISAIDDSHTSARACY